jgi:hypothetical protein
MVHRPAGISDLPSDLVLFREESDPKPVRSSHPSGSRLMREAPLEASHRPLALMRPRKPSVHCRVHLLPDALGPDAWITDWGVSPSPRAQSRFGSRQVRSSLKHSQNEFALLDGAAANQAKWLISIPFSSSLPQPALSGLLYPNALFMSNNTSSRMM